MKKDAKANTAAVTPGAIEMPVTLQDWQSKGGQGPSEGSQAAMDLKITLSDDRYEIEGPDGQAIVVELQDGDLRVMAYGQKSDGPAVTTIQKDGEISIDMEPYLAEKNDGLDMEP